MTGAFVKNEEGRIDLSLGTKSNRVEIVLSNGANKTAFFLTMEEIEQLRYACDMFKNTLQDRKHDKEMKDLSKDDPEE